jgi:ribosome biogenesis GTPase
MPRHHDEDHLEELEKKFRGENKRENRLERKIRSARDRSKYKKTDVEKLERQKEEEWEKLIKRKDLYRGRVLSVKSQEIIVDYEGKLFSCTVRGTLKQERERQKNILTIGDFVRFEKIGENEGAIVVVEARNTVLSRADALDRRKEHVIAANIDLVLITASVVLPPIKTPLIDRYIIATDKGGMKPVVVVNKIDLLNEEGDEFIDQEREIYEELRDAYQKAGISFIGVSASTKEGLDELKAIMKDKASVFSGQSGVGKSSLINSLTGLELLVGEAVSKTKKGSHTTTTAALIPLSFGGFCIDTPGIKSFGVWDLRKQEIEDYFDEIHALGCDCRFPDCSHTHEEGCRVLTALEEGSLSPLRYYSYEALLQTIDDEHLRR